MIGKFLYAEQLASGSFAIPADATWFAVAPEDPSVSTTYTIAFDKTITITNQSFQTPENATLAVASNGDNTNIVITHVSGGNLNIVYRF